MICPELETLEDLEWQGPSALDRPTLGHIRQCPTCKAELAELRRERSALALRADRRELPLPPFAALRVQRSLPSATWGSAPRSWTAGIATLAAAMAAMVLQVRVHRPSSTREPAELGVQACFPPEASACASALLSPMASAEPSWAACLTASAGSNLKCERAQALVCDAESEL